jgi:SAM-dependent methyltransferase
MIVLVASFTAQAESGQYRPEAYQAGKDVAWVPTEQALVEMMLDMAKVTPQDYVIDLGSGDGRTVIAAAKRGARALGIEYNPDMIALSKRNAAREGLADRAQFIKGDLFESDFSGATVVTMFLLTEINLKLRPKILGLKPGTRILSNTFGMGEWKADLTGSIDGRDECPNLYCTAYFWIVPARVEGSWKLPQGELTLKQNFQVVSGTLGSGDDAAAVTNCRLRGDQISFTAGGSEYTGKVRGDTMEGTVRSGGATAPWSASRMGKLVAAPLR